MTRPIGLKYNTKPKDEVMAAPPTHHIIRCRHCEKESKEPLRYTRICHSCRNHREYRFNRCYAWDTWGNK